MTESTLESFLNHDLVSTKLTMAGMTTTAANQKASLFADAANRLSHEGISTHQRAVACFVPGRIEVLGKHTDYAGGRSLLVAAERGLCAVGAPREDGKVVMIDAGSNQRAEIEMEPNASAQPSHWSNYPATVVRRMVQNFSGTYQGVTLTFASDRNKLWLASWRSGRRHFWRQRRPHRHSLLAGRPDGSVFLLPSPMGGCDSDAT